MKFPHPCTITPSIENPNTGQRYPGGTPFTTKGFFISSSSSEALPASAGETGQRAQEYWTLFLPASTPEFDAWSEIHWDSSKAWQDNRTFEVFGPPKPAGGTRGTVHHIEVRLREVDRVG